MNLTPVSGEAHADATIEGLAAASVEDYLEYFKANGLGVAKKLLEYPIGRNPNYGTINSKVRLALDTIKSSSLIDRLRVEDLIGNFVAYENSMTSSTDVDEKGNPIARQLPT